MAGRFVTVRKTVSASKGHLSEMDEAAVVVQAVRSNVLSKLTADDQGRFLELLRDGFPNVDQRKVENVEFEAALSAAFEELGLMMNPIQVRSVIFGQKGFQKSIFFFASSMCCVALKLAPRPQN
jgi:hypothetical protein